MDSAHHVSKRIFIRRFQIQTQCRFLEIEDLLTQESQTGRTFGDSVGGTIGMYSSSWSNAFRYHIFDTRPDTEFQRHPMTWRALCISP
jgi:hypothetical protein